MCSAPARECASTRSSGTLTPRTGARPGEVGIVWVTKVAISSNCSCPNCSDVAASVLLYWPNPCTKICQLSSTRKQTAGNGLGHGLARDPDRCSQKRPLAGDDLAVEQY